MEDEEIFDWLGRDQASIRRDGAMSASETAVALTAYRENAGSLLDDALLLAANDRISRAAPLAVLALEELAKVPMLANAFTLCERGGKVDAWEDFWKKLGKHRDKQAQILSYGSIIRKQFEGASPLDTRLYRYYAPAEVFPHLDRFKQSGFYVDLRKDGVQSPNGGPEVLASFDYLLTFAQERFDSFGSWHATVQRSADFLGGQYFDTVTGLASPSFETAEIEADIAYQASALSAGLVPDYFNMKEWLTSYASRVAEDELTSAITNVSTAFRRRMDLSARLPRYRDRFFGAFKIFISMEQWADVLPETFRGDLKSSLLRQPAQMA